MPEDELIVFIRENNLTCYEDYILDEYRIKNLSKEKDFVRIKGFAKNAGYRNWYDMKWDALEPEIEKSCSQLIKDHMINIFRDKNLKKEKDFASIKAFVKREGQKSNKKYEHWYDLEWEILEPEIEKSNSQIFKKLIKEEYEFKRSDKFYNNSYFSPLLNLATETLGGGKWPWCNMPVERITEAIDKELSLRKYKNLILGFRDCSKVFPTIYIGDMFYYHETDQKKLEGILDNLSKTDLQAHCQEMLRIHIELLKEQKANVKYVYINNATVSGWVTAGDNSDTVGEIDGVPVFYGGMLSGGHVDNYSNRRLVNEINAYLSNHGSME